MPRGFRVRDAITGVIVVDLNDRLSRITGRYTTTANRAGSIVIPDAANGTPFFVSGETFSPPFTNRPPQFTLSGAVVSWTAAPRVVTFTVGVY